MPPLLMVIAVGSALVTLLLAWLLFRRDPDAQPAHRRRPGDSGGEGAVWLASDGGGGRGKGDSQASDSADGGDGGGGD